MLSSLRIPELGAAVPRSLALVLVGRHPPRYLAICVASSSLSDMLTPPCSKCCFGSYTLAVPFDTGGLFFAFWFPVPKHDLTSNQIDMALVMRCMLKALYHDILWIQKL